MGLLDSFGFDNIELWRSEEMQLVQVCCWQELPGGVQPATRLHVSTAPCWGLCRLAGRMRREGCQHTVLCSTA